MSIITIETPFNIDLEFRIAPFHKRLLAWGIDLIIIYTFVYATVTLLWDKLSTTDTSLNILLAFAILITGYSYHLLMHIFMGGQTVGKMAMGIKVVDKSGESATLSQYLLRWLFRLVDMGISFGAVGAISAAVTTDTQRVGDLVANTIVIDKRYKASIEQTIYLDIEEKDYTPMFPQVMKLSDRDINGIRNLLAVKKIDRDTENYIYKVVHRIKEVLKVETQMDGLDFLQQLLEDYNYLTRK